MTERKSMTEYKLKIADKVILIKNVNDNVKERCGGFVTRSEGYDFSVTTDSENIRREREINGDESGERFGDEYLEYIALNRKLAEKMLDYDTFLMHGSVVCVGDDAFMFTAASGVGKTTRTMFFLDQIEGSFVVNGDKPFLTINDSFVSVHGTPWAGKENLGTNTTKRLRAVVFLERSEKSEIKEISYSEAFLGLLGQVYMPKSPELRAKTLDLIAKLDKKLKFYRWKTNLDDTDMKKIYRKIAESE